MSRVGIFLTVILLQSALAFGQARDVRIVTDTGSAIRSCSPLAGQIRFNLESEQRVSHFPSFMRGGMEIFITGPDGVVLKIDQESVNGGDFGSFGISPGDVFLEGEYCLLFFLVRTPDGFIFDEPGKYQVLINFAVGTEKFSGDIEVSVEDCSDCGKELYKRCFHDSWYVTPFSRGLKDGVRNGVYLEYSNALEIARLYCDSMIVVPFVYGATFEKLQKNHEYLQQHSRVFDWCISIAQNMAIDQEFWRYVADKYFLVMNGEPLDSLQEPARRYLCMR